MTNIDAEYDKPLTVPALQMAGQRLRHEQRMEAIVETRKVIRTHLRDAISAGRTRLDFPLEGSSRFFFFLDNWDADPKVFEEVIIPELLDERFTVRVYQPQWFWGLIKGDRRCEITWELP